jgi:hypothetical protein
MALLTVSQDLGVFGWGDDSQIFRDILSLPIMMPIVQGLVGPGFRMDHSPFCIRMQRGSEGQALHATSQPGSYDPLSTYQWDNGRIHCGLIVVQYQLAAVGEGDGGWCCLPGSHKGNVTVPPELRNMDPAHPGTRHVYQPVCEPGDAIIFTERLTHGAFPWDADHERRSVLYRYIPGPLAYVAHRSGPEQFGYLSAAAAAAADDDRAMQMQTGWPADWLDGMTPEQLALMQPPYHTGAREHFDTATGMLDQQRSDRLSKMAAFARSGDGTPQEPLTQANYEKWRRIHAGSSSSAKL